MSRLADAAVAVVEVAIDAAAPGDMVAVEAMAAAVDVAAVADVAAVEISSEC